MTRNVTADTDRCDGAEAGGGVHLGEGQAQHARDHGRRAGEDRWRSPVECELHRLVPVSVPSQLLAVPGHQEQRVVRAGTDDQDGQDGLALAVDREVGVLREEVDQPLGDGEGYARADDRQEPQHGAAIGQQQDHDDDPEGGEQQGAVDALEHLGRVRGLATRAADVDVHPVALGDLAELGGDLGHLHPPVGAEVERDERLHHPSVLGRLRALYLSLDTVHVRELRDVRLGSGHVGRGQAGGTFVDDQGRYRVGVLERREPVEGSGRFRGGRQPGRGLVVLDVGELRREAARHPDGQDPGDQHEPLGHAPCQLAGDPSMHAQFDHSRTADSSGIFQLD